MSVEMETDNQFQQILIMDELLEKIEIPHYIVKWYDGWKIVYNRAGIRGVALQSSRSLGGFYDQIEVVGFDLTSRMGYLSAEEAFAFFAKANKGLEHLPKKRKKRTIKRRPQENVITN